MPPTKSNSSRPKQSSIGTFARLIVKKFMTVVPSKQSTIRLGHPPCSPLSSPRRQTCRRLVPLLTSSQRCLRLMSSEGRSTSHQRLAIGLHKQRKSPSVTQRYSTSLSMSKMQLRSYKRLTKGHWRNFYTTGTKTLTSGHVWACFASTSRKNAN